MKIIVTIIPTDLVKNSLLSSFCPFLQTKNKNQVSANCTEGSLFDTQEYYKKKNKVDKKDKTIHKLIFAVLTDIRISSDSKMQYLPRKDDASNVTPGCNI